MSWVGLVALCATACTGSFGTPTNGGTAPGQGNGSTAGGSGTTNPSGDGTQIERPGVGNVDPGKSPVDFAAPPPPTTDATAFTCNASAVPATTPTRRLTAAQIRNTLKDVFAFALKKAANANESLTALSEIDAAVATLPIDERPRTEKDLRGSFRRLDQALDQQHVEAMNAIATAAGAALTKGARLTALAGACASDQDRGNDAACVDAFLKSTGERILRAPLSADDLTFYKRFFDLNAATAGTAQGFADLVAGLLSAPSFLYVIESGDGTTPGGAATAGLTGFELASRLSYHFWQSMPDEALWQAAKSGALATKDGLAAQVTRLWSDPRTRDSLDDFYREYFKVEDLSTLVDLNDNAGFKMFAGSDMPTKMLRQNMMDEVVALARHFTFDDPQAFETLFTTDASFARTDDLAKIYGGIAKWVPGQTPPKFEAGTRPGVLTRAALLASGLSTTRPVQKGVFIRRSMLCDEIPPPPPTVMAVAPPPSTTQTQRQVLEAMTEKAGTQCAACHIGLINNLGYPTEGFDALGRARQMERLITLDGKDMGQIPVQTRAVPQVVLGDTRVVETPADFMRTLVASGKAQACFARNYFRFTFGRFESNEDGCMLERMRQSLSRGGTLGAMLRDAALSAEFKQRSFD